jgi:PAS domain S-box-containing protein
MTLAACMTRRARFPYAALFEAIPIGLYRRTPDGRLLDVNPAMVTASGYPTRQALLGRPVTELYADSDDAARFEEAIARDGFVRGFETRLKRFDAPPVWVEANAVAVHDANGQVAWYEGTLTPISRRKEMELELRRSEQQLRAILDALDVIVAIVDADQRFVAVLGHNLRDLGVATSALAGKTLREVFGRRLMPVLDDAFGRAMAGERVAYEWLMDVPGVSRWFQVSLFPLREATGEVMGLVATAYDMTHLKQTQEKLASALAEKDALLKEVHHRVKNNLQIISSLLSLQFDRVQDPDLRTMVRESRQRILAMALVHEQLYRSETLMRLDTRVFLDSLVWSLVRSYATPAQPVDAVVEAAPVPLDLDVAISVALVINELVSNSLKHAFTGRSSGNRLEVTLRAGADGRRELVVSDNGVGMPPGFDLASAPTLGLSLVANLVRQIGGVVECRSAAGTEFRVSF